MGGDLPSHGGPFPARRLPVRCAAGCRAGYRAVEKTLSSSRSAARRPFEFARRDVRPAEPKYQNPKTGETWSGRGRAPLWIRDAKNRDRFLIAK
ncbi:H-NS histone family protein [Burkholderia ambifaria]|nr:H-NS histone family protein [Burkholderia ambifaria]